ETFSLDGIIERSNKYNTKEHCPKGTVAILRQRNESKSVHLNTAEYSGQHFATIETMLDGSIYRGAEADISIHDLKLQNNQYSKCQIWLENGPPDQLNSIQAGWTVHPRLYGDSVTRFTIYWTVADFKKTAHFNNVVIINSQYKRVYVEDRKIRRYADSYRCFRVTYWGYTKSTGVAFSFGGPGGNCGV
ncbi:predicted protein, partial [Arabidopsis lyrata subsp. lyrata]